MTDDLRARITQALAQHDCYDFAGGLECRCGEGFVGDDNNAEVFWAKHVADVVLSVLPPHLAHDNNGSG